MSNELFFLLFRIRVATRSVSGGTTRISQAWPGRWSRSTVATRKKILSLARGSSHNYTLQCEVIHADSTLSVTAWAGLALVSRAVREERGQIYSAPEVLQTTNRYNENDGVSKRVHELAFGIVICFGSTEFLHISSTLYMDALLRLHSPTTLMCSRVARARLHRAPPSLPPWPRLSRQVARASRHRAPLTLAEPAVFVHWSFVNVNKAPYWI